MKVVYTLCCQIGMIYLNRNRFYLDFFFAAIWQPCLCNHKSFLGVMRVMRKSDKISFLWTGRWDGNENRYRTLINIWLFISHYEIKEPSVVFYCVFVCLVLFRIYPYNNIWRSCDRGRLLKIKRGFETPRRSANSGPGHRRWVGCLPFSMWEISLSSLFSFSFRFFHFCQRTVRAHRRSGAKTIFCLVTKYQAGVKGELGNQDPHLDGSDSFSSHGWRSNLCPPSPEGLIQHDSTVNKVIHQLFLEVFF